MKLRGKLKILRVSARDADDIKKMLRIHASSTRRQDESVDSGYLVPPEIVKSMAAIATKTVDRRMNQSS